jgi:hypothetical protein
MARRPDTAASLPGRRAGRLPMLIVASSGSGVAARKYGTKPGVSYTTLRYSAAASAARRSMQWCQAGSGGASGATVASSVAVVYTSSVRTAMSTRPNFASIVSPCSVRRSEPVIARAGCDWIARYVGPPPRPMLPPRP